MLSTLRNALGYFIVAAALLILFIPGFSKMQGLRDKNKDLEDKIRRLNIENALLHQELKGG